MTTTETKAAYTPKVGDIFEMSWGYDQTNVNWFQVTRLSKGGVFVREIGSKGVPGTDGFMCQSVVPFKDSFLARSQWCGGFDSNNPEMFRKVNQGNWKPYFSIRSRYYAYLWDGEPAYNSWYA